MATRVVIEASSSRDCSHAYCFRTVYQLELTGSSWWTMDGSIVSRYPCLCLPLQPEKGSPVNPGKQVQSNEPLLELPLVHCAKNPHGAKLHGSVWRVRRDITQVLLYKKFGDNMLYIQSWWLYLGDRSPEYLRSSPAFCSKTHHRSSFPQEGSS